MVKQASVNEELPKTRLYWEKLGYPPRETIVVEDSPSGIRSAVGAGVGTIYAIDVSLGRDAYAHIPQVRGVVHDFFELAARLGL